MKDKKLVYTAFSKCNFYFRLFISKFVFKKGYVPLTPFLICDYFMLDTVPRDTIRAVNNTLVKRCDEVWVFGQIANGVLAEINLAKKLKKTIKYFDIKNSQKIIPTTFKKLEIEK
jgi:hypothetical protein